MERLRSRNVPLVALFGMVGLLVGIGSYTFYYAQGASYLSNDPRACVNCHIMRHSTTAGRNLATTSSPPATTATCRMTLLAST